MEQSCPHRIHIFLPFVLKKKITVIHFHWFEPLFMRKALLPTVYKAFMICLQLLLLKIFKIHFVWTAHNLKNHENRYPRLYFLLAWLMVRRSDAIIAHCHAAKSQIIEKFKLQKSDKIHVIDHGNFIDYYINKISRKQARKMLSLPEETVLFLFLGQTRPYKGVIELIESYEKIAQANTHLLIVGKARNLDFAKQITEKAQKVPSITFIAEHVPDETIQVYMNACDAVVFPYRDILTSGAVILAMSFGKACIAPAIGCIAEILDKKGAFIYEQGNPQNLTNVLHNALRQKDDLSVMGEHNLSKAHQLDWRSIARKTFNVYSNCLQ